MEQLNKTIKLASHFDSGADLLSIVETFQIRLGKDGLIHGTLPNTQVRENPHVMYGMILKPV